VLGAVLAAGAGCARPAPPARAEPAAPRATRWPVVIAHRGGAGLAPEETLFAMHLVVDRYAPVVLDADVRESADGALVLVHDATVDRTTDGAGPVGALSLAQLRGLDAAYCFSPEIPPENTDQGVCRAPPPGATFPLRGHQPRIALATVDELFAAFGPAQPIHLELKVDSRRAARALAERVVRYGRVATTCVGAFSDETTAWLREALPPAACVYAPESVYLCQARVRAAGDDVAAWRACGAARDLDVPLRLDGAPFVDAAYVARAHAEGRVVRVWTVSDEPTLRALLSWGVDGVFTDRPDRLSALLAPPRLDPSGPR
jgi:glycerophosphoryl diester phosphodiesterase